MHHKYRWIFAFILAVGLLPQSGHAAWEPMESWVNYNATCNASNPSLHSNGGSLYLTWQEFAASEQNNIYTAVWNGTAWAGIGTDGERLDNYVIDQSETPSMTYVNGAPCVAWAEIVGSVEHIFVKDYPAASWNLVGSNPIDYYISTNATQPRIGNYNGYPLVAWIENTPTGYGERKLHARWHNGISWNGLPGGVVDVAQSGVTSNAYALSLAINNSIPFLAWQEGWPVASNLEPGGNIIRVKYYNGSNWANAGIGKISEDAYGWAGEPSTAVDNTYNLLVAYSQGLDFSNRVIKIKRFNGIAWSEITAPVTTAQNAGNPVIAVDSNNNLFLAWVVDLGNTQIYAARYNGSSWDNLGLINNNVNANAWAPSLTIHNDQPVLAWSESNGVETVYVKRWVEPTPTVTATVTQTPVVTATPTLDASGATATSSPTPGTPTPEPGSLVEVDQTMAYPMPATTQVNFAFRITDGSGDPVVRVYNTHFRLVAEIQGATTSTGEGTVQWNCSDIAPGVYFYQVAIGDKKTKAAKFIIAR